MPRNSSGIFTLPPSNPVVANTTIATSWANPTMSDLANGLSNSLDRTGLGGMLAAFKIADGTISAPGLGFTNEPGTGWYRPGTNEMSAVIGGTKLFQVLVDRIVSPVKMEHRGLDTFKASGSKSWKNEVSTDFLTFTPSITVNGEDWNTAAVFKLSADGSISVSTDLTVGRDFNVLGNLALSGTLGVSSISSAGGISAAGDIISTTVDGRFYSNGIILGASAPASSELWTYLRTTDGLGEYWRHGMGSDSQFYFQKLFASFGLQFQVLSISKTTGQISINTAISACKGYAQTPVVSGASGSTALDYNSGQSMILTLSGAFTITAINNIPSGTIMRILFLNTAAGTVTWPGTVIWTTGSPPSLSSGAAKKASVTLLNDGSGSLLASYSVW